MYNVNNATLNEMDKMLDTAEAARLLHVHPNTLRRWCNHGLIRTYRIGPRHDRRFRYDDINHFLVKFRENAGDPYK